jgi:hypothetical protein
MCTSENIGPKIGPDQGSEMGADEFFNKLIFLLGSRMNRAGCIKPGP